MKKVDLPFLVNKQIKEIALFILVAVIILIIDSSFVLKGQWRNFLSLKDEVAQAREKISATSLDALGAGGLKQRLDKLSASVSEKKKGVLKEEDIPNVLGEISKLADEVDLKIMRMTPLKEIRDADKFRTSEDVEYYTLPISLVARGAYHSLGKFLNSLEKTIYSIRIKTISITPQAAGLLNPNHDIKLSLSIFVVEKYEKP